MIRINPIQNPDFHPDHSQNLVLLVSDLSEELCTQNISLFHPDLTTVFSHLFTHTYTQRDFDRETDRQTDRDREALSIGGGTVVPKNL